MSLEKIEFFGAADRKGKVMTGMVTSEYPAWYFTQHIEELQEEIDSIERKLKNGGLPSEAIPDHKAELFKLQGRLMDIQNSRPKLNGKDADTFKKIYDDLSGQIGDSMFTETEMKKGLVNVHEEARRMVEPIIKADPEYAPVFEKLGISPIRGKISRNQAAKVVKICGRLIDDSRPTNIEYFRKDRNYGTYRSERSLAELEKE